MTLLASKIQYKDFEIGEFVEEKKRTFEETIELIEHFPWEAERENIVINLTNPSVTINGKNNDYLKLAIFYNGKFVLYYFDQKQTLFTKSLYRIKDTYKYIKCFFDLPSFDVSDFKKENTLFQSNLKHFLSQDFCYEITPKVIKNYLLSTSAISFGFTIFIILFFAIKQYSQTNALGIVAILLAIFLIGGGLNLILLFNYYLYTKNKILIMSKGNEIFYFGNKENPAKYEKGEILRFVTSKVRNSKNPVSSFAVVTIQLKSGITIEIPNILIEHLALEHKLKGIPSAVEYRFPLVQA